MTAIRMSAAWRGSLASLPGVGAALLPVGGCPACWPLYAGVLASLGLGFLLDPVYRIWTTLALLCLALLALAFRAKGRRGFGPLVLGAASAGIIVFFKFAWVFEALVYVGLSGLVIASLWNAWPKKMEKGGGCCGCGEQQDLDARRTQFQGG